MRVKNRIYGVPPKQPPVRRLRDFEANRIWGRRERFPRIRLVISDRCSEQEFLDRLREAGVSRLRRILLLSAFRLLSPDSRVWFPRGVGHA
jgi:hypothetical protein